jgi:hypothetical protein
MDKCPDCGEWNSLVEENRTSAQTETSPRGGLSRQRAKGLLRSGHRRPLKAVSVSGVDPEVIEASRTAYRRSGLMGYWREQLAVAKKRAQPLYVMPYNVARTCARLGTRINPSCGSRKPTRSARTI